MKNFFTESLMYKLMMSIIIFMFFTMAYNTYLRFYPFKTLVVNKVEVLTPGGQFKYRVDYCKYTDVVSTSYKTFYDASSVEKRYPLGAMEGVGAVGCHIAERSIKLEDLPVGEYYMKTVVSYQLNNYQNQKVEFITPNFIVTK